MEEVQHTMSRKRDGHKPQVALESGHGNDSEHCGDGDLGQQYLVTAALSPGRFRHLFVAHTGTSFRAYVLWTRLNVAIQFAMVGRSWTEAAHAAGFADSAHLTRTFRRMFGINPAALVPR